MAVKIPKQTGLDRWLLNWFRTYGAIKAGGLLVSALLAYGGYRDVRRGNIDKAEQEKKEFQQRLKTEEEKTDKAVIAIGQLAKMVSNYHNSDSTERVKYNSENDSQHKRLFHNDSIFLTKILEIKPSLIATPGGLVQQVFTKEVKKKPVTQ
jgi:hypothetical protein